MIPRVAWVGDTYVALALPIVSGLVAKHPMVFARISVMSEPHVCGRECGVVIGG